MKLTCCNRTFGDRQALMQHRNAHKKTQNVQRVTPRPSVVYKPVNTGRIPNMAIRNSLMTHKDILGATVEGREWAMRALHPCDDTTSKVVGIPDLTAAQTTCIEVRHNQVLAAPSDAIGNWDCQLVVLPCVDAVVVYRTRPSTVTKWSIWRQLSYAQGNVLSGAMRPKMFDHTTAPPTVSQDVGVIRRPTLEEQAIGFRQTFKGLTVVMNSNSITNQGIVTAGQWLSKPRMEDMRPYVGEVAEEFDLGTKYGPQTQGIFADIPTEPDDIVVKCAEAMQIEARKGVYMPMRFQDPVHPYNSGSGSPLQSVDATVGQPSVQACGTPIVLRDEGTLVETDFNYGDGMVWSVDPTLNSSGNYITGTVVTTAGFINQNVGVVIFSGIDKTAMLMVKTRTGLEEQPITDSPLAATVKDAPPADDSATRMVQSVQRELPLAYEHKFNSLGFLVPLISKAAAAVLPSVMPWLASKAGGFLSKIFGRNRTSVMTPPSRYIEEDVE